MKEININIEGYNEHGICVGCLNYNRNMFYTNEIQECFLNLADIDVPDGVSIQVCWECLAAVRTVNRFRAQLLQSFDILMEYSKKHTFLTSPSDLSQYAKQRLRPSIVDTYSTVAGPDHDKDDLENKTEVHIKIEPEDEMKYEIDLVPLEPDIRIKEEYTQDTLSEDFQPAPGESEMESDDDVQLSLLKDMKKKEMKDRKSKKETKDERRGRPKIKTNDLNDEPQVKGSKILKNLPENIKLHCMAEDEMWQKISTFQQCDACKAYFLTTRSHMGDNGIKCDLCDTTDRPAYDHTMADQPEPMEITDLPLPRSNILTEAKTAASTSTPFDEPPTPKKTKAEKQREYRQRLAASRTRAEVIAARKAAAERQRISRLRKAANLALGCGSLESTTASRSKARSNVQTGTQRQTSAAESAQSDQIDVQQALSTYKTKQIKLKEELTWNTKWATSILRFKSTFLDNDFGYACSVCDRLWFKNDLKPITEPQLEVISEWCIKHNLQLCREEYEMVCNICKRTLNKKSMPPLAKVNGFSYPDQPNLPPLDPISERLISPLLPFMQVRRLRQDASGIIGQVINVPVDEKVMAKCLPRQLNDDAVINVNIGRNLAYKSVYISTYMSKSTISEWLTVLQKSSLYRLYKINVDLSRLHDVQFLDDESDPSERIENISAENTPESEILASREHTMMWNEEDYVNVTPGHKATPLDIYDRNAEELSFPSIYFGEPRGFNTGVAVTPRMIAASEIRRRDRRGAIPQKILYVAMKILRLRMVKGIDSMICNVSTTENVTRRMLEDPEFLKEYVIQNLAFMKTVPNSVQYWASRKRDLFAMIRQLGKPTVLLTISANEIRWMKLLTILLKLSKKYPGKAACDLNASERCTLVNDDPVTCCIYFYRLVSSLMKMLKSKQTYNPFGKYSVKDYFLRIEFQGSPRAHILLWMNDDPREVVSEDMPRTIELVEKITSVARVDVPNDSIYANQIHEHTSTCTKGETTCRFPYWPMPTTRILIPMPQSDERRQTLEQKAKDLRTSLGERHYASMDEFLNTHGLTQDSYLDIVRSTLRRPTLLFRRNFDELLTNTFNPYLAGEVNSNIDIQFILDEYSCAEYVVEYVNKSARGMSDLRRELSKMMQEDHQDYTGQLKALSIKLLNAVEMSAQEAAWYLLQQPMSETSRQVVYIPTVWPTERQRCRKRRLQMDREGLDADSTDIWTKNIIQRYEERPPSLEGVYLAEFAAWYANANDFVDEEDDDVHDEDSEAVPEARTSTSKEYRRRPLERVIRYKRYDIDETLDYKREMVLLYVPFRNEISEIIDENKFLQLYDDNIDTIMERHGLFETNLNIENLMKEQEAMILQNDENSNLQEGE